MLNPQLIVICKVFICCWFKGTIPRLTSIFPLKVCSIWACHSLWKMVNPCCSSQPAPTRDAHPSPQAPGQPERILKMKETNRVWTSRQLPKTAKWASFTWFYWRVGWTVLEGNKLMESFICKAIFIYIYLKIYAHPPPQDLLFAPLDLGGEVTIYIDVKYLYIYIHITFRESINDVCNTSNNILAFVPKKCLGDFPTQPLRRIGSLHCP